MGKKHVKKWIRKEDKKARARDVRLFKEVK